MRKILILSAFFGLFSTAIAQIEVGIQFSPNISINRIDGLDKDGKVQNYTVNKNKSGMRFSAGPVVDIFLSDNIALSTGLFFTIKRASMEFSFEDPTAGKTVFDPVINLQYIQAPLAIKMYTNEIASRMQLYFSLGGTLDIKIAENLQNRQSVDFDKEFAKLVDAGLFLGAGVEKGIGQSNKVFMGFTYNRGLVNVLTKDYHQVINRKNKIIFNNDLISLVAGFKF